MVWIVFSFWDFRIYVVNDGAFLFWVLWRTLVLWILSSQLLGFEVLLCGFFIFYFLGV